MEFNTIIGDKLIKEEHLRLGLKSWPNFILNDKEVVQYLPELYSVFLDYQFAAFSGDDILGVGNTVPIQYNDDFSALPEQGLNWGMSKAMDDYKKGLKPNLLIAVQILINTEIQGKGLSYKFLNSMKDVGRNHGIENIALPVRPTLKHLYPLIAMDEYIRWKNKKGDPYDPWIRVHLNAGGKIISVCHESMSIRGEISEWEEWTGLSFQTSGLYTIDKALVPVQIDLENNTGKYVEPNLWIIHNTKKA